MSRENKDRLALRMRPDTKQKIEQWYMAAGCHSRNQFVERAVNFYADHLATQSNDSLPGAITSALDGRLGMFEDRMSSLLYKHAVELDMMAGILADSYEFTPEEIRRRAEHYRPQLEAYSLALSRVLERAVVRKVLYFLEPGETVEL